MALLGIFGPVVFECSRRKVLIYDNVKVQNQSRYATHDVHMQLPILEFTGPGLTEVNFTMNLNKEWNSDPFATVVLLRQFNKSGLIAPLIIGNRPLVIGFNLWVLMSVGEEHKWFTRHGELFGASVDVKLQEYRVLL